MTPLLIAAASLLLMAGAAVTSAFTLDGRPESAGWVTAAAGTASLALTALSGSTNLWNLTAVFGIVVFAGLAGAGWNPRGKRILLAAGSASFILGLIGCLLALAPILVSVLAGTTPVLGNLPWAVSRASGFIAFVAATGAVVLGARRPSRLRLGGMPARVYALHRAFGITAVSALAVHLISLWADTFIEFSWMQLLLTPWSASYRPFAVTLGWVSAILLLLTAASGALRKVLPGWRSVHLLSYATVTAGLFHGLLAGSDSATFAARAFYIAAFLLVALAWSRRLYLLVHKPVRRPVTSERP
jgi:sulfoxide reductase heme-binding subunit YedZ